MGGFKRLKLLLDTHIILWSAAEPEKLLPEIGNKPVQNSDDNEQA